jgi:chromosomal replication initiation ATPase DnaA
MQLAFAFAGDIAFRRADFVLAPANEDAWEWATHPAAWPSARLVLSGPPGSGKTHLAAIFADAADAPMLHGAALATDAIPDLLPAHGSAVIDAAEGAAEHPLLHLLNLAAERGGRVLMTARAPAAAWGTALPDLRSRLAASGAAALRIPDDALLRAVLAKAAAERQLRLAPALLEWLAARLPRDLAAAAATIAALDAAALAAGRAPDLRLARLVLPASHEIPMTTAAEASPPAGRLL